MQNDFDDFYLKMYYQGREELCKERKVIDEQIAGLDRRIALRKEEIKAERAGQSQPIDKPVEVGRYAGLQLKNALQNYLAERGGGPINLVKAGADLLIGGVKYGTGTSKRTPAHHISIMASSGKNRDIFIVDKATKTVSLARGAVTPKPPGRARGPKP